MLKCYIRARFSWLRWSCSCWRDSPGDDVKSVGDGFWFLSVCPHPTGPYSKVSSIWDLVLKATCSLPNSSILASFLCPPLAILFVLSVFHMERWVSKNLVAFFILMAFTILTMVWTNPYHWLYYTYYYTIDIGPFPMLGLKHGPLLLITL